MNGLPNVRTFQSVFNVKDSYALLHLKFLKLVFYVPYDQFLFLAN